MVDSTEVPKVPLGVEMGVREGKVFVRFTTELSWFEGTPAELRGFFEGGVALCDRLQEEEVGDATQLDEQSGNNIG